jgi:hypothetical protein
MGKSEGQGRHIKDGLFQSDKYPTCPPGKVPLSTCDPMAQDLLWEYAQRRRAVDAEFSADLEACLIAAGFSEGLPRVGLTPEPPPTQREIEEVGREIEELGP